MLDNRKQENAITSYKISILASPAPEWHSSLGSRLFIPGVAMDKPTNTAIVNRELTLTRSSSSFRWTSLISKLSFLAMLKFAKFQVTNNTAELNLISSEWTWQEFKSHNYAQSSRSNHGVFFFTTLIKKQHKYIVFGEFKKGKWLIFTDLITLQM